VRLRLGPVLADDFTGACDVGAELLGLGRRVRIVSAGRALDGIPDDVRWVVNTQSRAVEAEEACRRVEAALPSVLDASEIAFKKIDTALRGHVAAELATAIERLDPRVVIVAPAIPSVGRTTEGGVQMLGGVPVSETAFRRDPVNPVVDADLRSVLAGLSPLGEIHALPLETVRDTHRLEESVRTATARGRVIVVADATRDDDLGAVVGAVAAEGGGFMAVGSIGLAAAIASLTGPEAKRVASATPEDAAGDGVLVVCGSLHPVARRQLVSVEERWGVPRCEVGDQPGDVGRAVGNLVAACGIGVLASPMGGRAYGRVVQGLEAAVRAAFEIQMPRALVLIGGETAYHTLRVLGDPIVELRRSEEPLVVEGVVVDGSHRGLRLYAKGGSAGDEEAINRMIEREELG